MIKISLITIIGICFASLLVGQNVDSKYFSSTEEDERRWKIYENFIENNQNDKGIKADSILKFAQKEYKLQQELLPQCHHPP